MSVELRHLRGKDGETLIGVRLLLTMRWRTGEPETSDREASATAQQAAPPTSCRVAPAAPHRRQRRNRINRQNIHSYGFARRCRAFGYRKCA